MASRFASADVGPDRRDGSPRCGSCRGSRRPRGAAATACSSLAAVGHVHERRRRELRHVAHDRDQRVVLLGRRPPPPRRRGRAPTTRTVGVRRRVGVGASGVSTQVAPTNRSASAPSRPSCSEPAIGWPPTKRGRARAGRASTAATTGAFTEPTSVTSARAGVERRDHRVGDRADRHRDEREVGAGDRRRARSARERVDRAQLARARRRARRRGRSRRRRARAPRARGRSSRRSGRCRRARRDSAATVASARGRSSRRRPRALEVHVVQLVARPLAVEVHQHPDAAAACRARCRARGRTSSGTSPRPSAAGRGGRELGGEVVGGGEDDADEVVVRRRRCARASPSPARCVLASISAFGVLVARGRAAQRQQSHGRARLARASSPRRPRRRRRRSPPRTSAAHLVRS